MGTACCKYADKDLANQNFGDKTIKKGAFKIPVLDPESAAIVLAKGNANLKAVLKV